MQKLEALRANCISALIASESTRNEDHHADPANVNKTIREIRKENRDEDKIL